MNAFEDIVKLYLEEEGYWVRQSVKVSKITKEDKRELKNPTMPTPEIDLVALHFRRNELVLIEAKSYLDSYGVYYEAVTGNVTKKYEEKDAKRYRLLNDDKFRKVVTERLKEDYFEKGLINQKTKINYGLAAGNIKYPEDEQRIREHFSKQNEKWILFSPKDIKQKIKKLSDKGWEDNLVTITAKLILREEKNSDLSKEFNEMRERIRKS